VLLLDARSLQKRSNGEEIALLRNLTITVNRDLFYGLICQNSRVAQKSPPTNLTREAIAWTTFGALT
jgi:hypothetical protein